MTLIHSFYEPEDSVVLGERHTRRSRKEFLAFVGLWVPVDNGMVAFTRTGGDLLENEFLSAWNFQQRKIFNWRADENQIVVFGVVQRKEASSLEPDAAVKKAENAIEFVNGQNLADAGIVVENIGVAIMRRIAVTHARLGPADKSGVAENDPRLFRPRGETSPKNSKRGRDWFSFTREAHGSRSAGRQQPDDNGDGGGQEYGKGDDFCAPPALRTLLQ